MRHSMQPTVRPRLSGWAACVFFTLLLAGPCNLAASAADPPTTGVAAAPEAKTVETKGPGGKRNPLPPVRRVEFLSAIFLWCAIVVVGLALVAMVMVWGRRLRRAVRRQPPAPTVPDPFWYLKKTPSAVTQGEKADRSKDNETGHESGGRPMP